MDTILTREGKRFQCRQHISIKKKRKKKVFNIISILPPKRTLIAMKDKTTTQIFLPF
jgi:hypothetical protein